MTYISWSSDFSSCIFCSEHILVLLAKPNSGELRCPATALIKTDNNLKNIMADYHLHRMSLFLHYQIRFSCAHVQVLAFDYKSAFSVLHMHMPIFFSKPCTQLNSRKIDK